MPHSTHLADFFPAARLLFPLLPARFGTQSFAVKLLNNGDLHLGSWLIGIVYGFFILSNQIAPSIVGMIGAPTTTCCHSFLPAAQYLERRVENCGSR